MTDYAAARAAMVDCQIRPSDVTRYPIIDAFQAIRREVFVPSALRDVAYSGDMIDLGAGRFILDPRTFAKLLDGLSVTPSDLVLDLGSGLGYSAAILAHLSEAVVGVEPVADLAAEAQQLLSAEAIHNVVVENKSLVEGDPSHGPYDVIVIEGGIEALPDALNDQLKDGGRVAAIRMEGAVGRAQIGTKRGDRIAWRTLFDATAPVLEGFAAERAFQF